MDAYRREYYSGESTVNLREFQRDHTTSNNLDLCDDDLFEDLFPSSKSELDISKESVDPDHRLMENSSSKDGMSTPIQSEVLTDGHHPVQITTNGDDAHDTAIKQHVLYLMDQLPHSSNHNPYQMKVPKQEAPDSDTNVETISINGSHSPLRTGHHSPFDRTSPISSCSSTSSLNDTPFVPSMTEGTKELVSSMIKAEPVDIEELTKQRSRRGRKRKSTESENELTRAYDRENNEYKKKRLRNNIAVRKSRDKAKQRQVEVQTKLIALADENKAQKTMIEKIKTDYDNMEGRFEELNKRLEETLKINVRMRQFIGTLPLEYQPKFTL